MPMGCAGPSTILRMVPLPFPGRIFGAAHFPTLRLSWQDREMTSRPLITPKSRVREFTLRTLFQVFQALTLNGSFARC